MKLGKFALVLVLGIAVAGCGGGQTVPQGGETAAKGPVSGSAGPVTGAAAAEKTIEHAMGTAKLTKTPERVVVLFNGMVDISVALGVKPVGAVESWDEKPWFVYLRDQMEGVKNLGEESQPNVEAIVALKPDVIIGTKSRHEKIYPQLASIAPTVITEEVFNWKENLKIAAEVLDKQGEASRIMQDWDAKVALFKQKMGDRLGKSEVSIIRFERDGSARIYTTGFAGTIFQELGLPRPKAQQVEGKTVISLTSKEQIPQLDGDYIFDLTQLGETGDPDASKAKAQEEWTGHPLWKSLKGVQNGNYYKVNVVTWNLGGGALSAQLLIDDLYQYFGIQ